MTKSKFKIAGVLFLLIFILAVGASAFAAMPQDQDGNLLFSATGQQGSLDFLIDPTLTNIRNVKVNFDLLNGAEIGDVVVLNLFPSAVFDAVLDRIETNHSGGYTWFAHLAGVEYGSATLVVVEDLLLANISMPGAIYQVRYAGGGVHVILAIDQSKFPEEAVPIVVELSEETIAATTEVTEGDDGSIIDVMVVYTADARSNWGGTAAIEALIDLAVAETNTSYANSNIIQRLNLVHTEEVVYTETSDIGIDLGRLRNSSDGYMDNVHSLRDTHSADLVTLLVDDGGPYCGIAYLMTAVSTSFAPYGFSVVDTQCATGYFSYGHELGHNMAARHDWYVDDSVNSPYSYNKAYIYFPDRWRTVMAYNSECSARGGSCTRLQYWSNPDVSYGGIPMGVAAGTSTSCTEGNLSNPSCDADNHLTLNNTASTVANFRDSGGGAVGPLVFDSYLVDDDNNGQSSGNDDGVVDCGETIELFVDLHNQGPDTAEGVDATISTLDPYLTWLYNTDSSYPDIIGSGTEKNTDDFDFLVDSATPDGHLISFDLDISASNGGPWTDSFNVPVNCTTAPPEIEVSPSSFSITLQVDEIVTETLLIENLGVGQLDFSIDDTETDAADLRNDGSAYGTDGGNGTSTSDAEAHPEVKTVLSFETVPDAVWLSVSPDSGTISGGSSEFIDVVFDASGLSVGTYTADIVIENNDPDEDPVVVPVTMEVTSSGCPGGPNSDFFTTQDNEDNVGSGVGDCDLDVYLYNDNPLAPIEFNIFVPDASSISSADLLISNWDIDETEGEVDEVYFNGHLAGTLTGADNKWSTTTLLLDPDWIVTGDNLVEILVDILNPDDPTWAVNVDWGQIYLDQPQQAYIRYANILNSPPYQPDDVMDVLIEVDTSLASHDVHTEINLRDPSDVILTAETIDHTIVDTADDPVTADLHIPPGSPPGTYSIQILVFDQASAHIQDVMIIPFDVSVAQILTSPVETDVWLGNTVAMDINIEDVTGLYGVTFELTFDPDILNVVDADPGTPGIQITAGTCPSPDLVVVNSADNTTGTINFDVSASAPSSPCDGTGTIAQVEFSGVGLGTSPVHFNAWLLVNQDAIEISVTAQDGSITVIPEPAGTYEVYLPLILK
ncbi:MAG: hypothetical protein GTO18_16790 [Anaerolineales bacterium]|nr:hypothetical protein [Anaerolineales bacterium]